MAGIDSLISNRVDAFANNPQALMQRYSMSQDLLDLLALQKLKQEKEAAQRSLQMQMQAPQGTVKDQLEGQVMDMTRREVAQAAAPGLQQQGQRMVANQMQEAMGAGLPTQPAPALQGMAQGGIVGYQEGGDIVGYDGEGNPITREEFDAIVRSGERASGYELRQREKARMQERAGPEMQEFMQGAGEAVTGARDYIIENPLEAAGYAAMAIPAVGQLGAGLRLGAAGLQKAGPALMRGIRSLYSKPNTWERTFRGERLTGTLPGRTYSPGRTAATGSGLLGLDYLLDTLGNEATGQTQDAIADSTAPTSGTQVPSGRTPVEATSTEEYLDNIGVPRRTPATAPARTPAAPASPQDPEEVAYLRSLYRQYGLPAVAPQQEQTKEKPQFRSRYEDRLAEIEAEKQNKLGALIEFLQAAGASGGTNLGATLTGGGSGLRARDERLRQQETEALQGAIEEENAYLQRMFNEEQLRQQTENARLNREMQERISENELANRLDVVERQVEAARDELQARLDLSLYTEAGKAKSEQLTPANIMANYPELVSAYAEAWKLNNKAPSFVSGVFSAKDDEYEENARRAGLLKAMEEVEAKIDSYFTAGSSTSGRAGGANSPTVQAALDIIGAK